MVAYRPRIPISFTNLAETETFTFPIGDFSYEIDQELAIGYSALTGGHGAVDLLGDGTGVKKPIIVRIDCRVWEDSPQAVDTVIDEMLDELWRFGLGYLRTTGLESGVEVVRKTRARLQAMPHVSWQGGQILNKGVTLSFICPQAQWFANAQLADAGDWTINQDPELDFEVDNTGNDRIYDAVFTLRGTYTNPKIENLTNGYILESTRDGSSANHRLRFSAGIPAVDFSTDGGATWAGDYELFVRAPNQAHLMVLEKGLNEFRVTGANGATLNVVAAAAYH